MSMFFRLMRAGLPALALATGACQATPPPAAEAAATPAPAVSTPAPAASGDRSPVATALPVVLVHKSPTCGCCASWVEHLRAHGFTVEVDDAADMEAIKARAGVPAGKGSCHTAEVGGYFVEGHVPADDIVRLLAEKPDARGLTAPGMPVGSPGMEVRGQGAPPYAVELVRKDGSTEVFAEHGDGVAQDATH
jgi:hypothetical protein